MFQRLSQIATHIDAISEWIGRAVSWLVVLLVAIICYDVFMRYVFREGSVVLQEMQWHLFALIFLLGASYTFKHDDHVRVDILFNSRYLTDKVRAWINLLGTLLFLYPFAILITISSWSFVATSFMIGEGSPDPGGLPFRWLLKSSLPVAFVLLMLQGVSTIVRSLQVLMDDKDKTE